MKSRNIKQLIALILGFMVTFTTLAPTNVYASEINEVEIESQEITEETEENTIPTTEVVQANSAVEMNAVTENVVEEHTRLMVTSDVTLTEFFGAIECVKGYDNLYILSYEDTAACESAYQSFVEAGVTVE